MAEPGPVLWRCLTNDAPPARGPGTGAQDGEAVGPVGEAFPGLDAGCLPVGMVDFACTLWSTDAGATALGDAGYALACAASFSSASTS